MQRAGRQQRIEEFHIDVARFIHAIHKFEASLDILSTVVFDAENCCPKDRIRTHNTHHYDAHAVHGEWQLVWRAVVVREVERRAFIANVVDIDAAGYLCESVPGRFWPQLHNVRWREEGIGICGTRGGIFGAHHHCYHTESGLYDSVASGVAHAAAKACFAVAMPAHEEIIAEHQDMGAAAKLRDDNAK